MKPIKQSATAVITFTLFIMNTLFWALPILILSYIKLIPYKKLQHVINKINDQLSDNWVYFNKLNQDTFLKDSIKTSGLSQLSPNQSYIIFANHQSWVDIVYLQYALHKKTPSLKFFLKHELIYIPVLGLVWKALNFPFVKRKVGSDKEYDIQSTKQSCAEFKTRPCSLINFVEGTRFRPEKKVAAYEYLLPPKAGGSALAIECLYPHVKTILNITIFYPKKQPSFYDLLSGKIKNVIIDIQEITITPDLIGSYADPEFKKYFQGWLNQLWQNKDQHIKDIAQINKET
tara:strand:- start:28250 stop:29113 length:864 start_codon:yes stop_codon:yes gene_type:complete